MITIVGYHSFVCLGRFIDDIEDRLLVLLIASPNQTTIPSDQMKFTNTFNACITFDSILSIQVFVVQ